MTIYGDEGGYTGNQLLDDQDVFTYATIAIEQSEADEIVKRVQKDFRLQGGELKGRNLIKRPSNRKAVENILEHVQGRFAVTVHHKAFALCCKFFEYVFEPSVSDCNSFYYGTDFHLYIGTVLFRYLSERRKEAEELIEAFSIYARKGDVQLFRELLPAKPSARLSMRPLDLIGIFASLNQSAISEEIGNAHDGQPGWLLDLVRTAVYHQLTRWSEQLGQIEFVADDSKPLRLVRSLFDAFVGREEQIFVEFRGERHPYTFNLSRPIDLVDSRFSAGVQLADVVASAAAHAYSQVNRGEIGGEEHQWLRLLLTGTDQVVWPDTTRFGPRSKEGVAGKALLSELARRSMSGESLCDGMPEFLHKHMFTLAANRLRKRLLLRQNRHR